MQAVFCRILATFSGNCSSVRRRFLDNQSRYTCFRVTFRKNFFSMLVCKCLYRNKFCYDKFFMNTNTIDFKKFNKFGFHKKIVTWKYFTLASIYHSNIEKFFQNAYFKMW